MCPIYFSSPYPKQKNAYLLAITPCLAHNEGRATDTIRTSICSFAPRFDLVNLAPGRFKLPPLTTLPGTRRGWGRRRAKAGCSLRNAAVLYRLSVPASPLFIFIRRSALRSELESTLFYVFCFYLFSWFISRAFCFSCSCFPPLRLIDERRGVAVAAAKQIASHRKTPPLGTMKNKDIKEKQTSKQSTLS